MPQHTTSRRTVLRGLGATLGSGALLTGTAGARGRGFKWELARVRSATAQYNDPANAYADGYRAFGPSGPVSLADVTSETEAVCGMGYHLADLAFIGPLMAGDMAGVEAYFSDWDGITPQVLAYGADDEENLILGAVEWIIPTAIDPDPDLFDHDGHREHWDDGPFPGVHSLHAWVHTHNPDGVLHHTNPRKQFHPDGCMPH